MNAQLSGSHQKIYERIFGHPLPHNLQWREVCSMLKAMTGTQIIEDEKGNIKVIRNSRTLTLHRPLGKDLADSDELMQIRHFLDQSTAPTPTMAKVGTHLLVVIDHREARIYSMELQGSVPHRITPYDPLGYGRALHYNQYDSNGQRKPEIKSFYEAVAKTLHGAEQIVMFGTGTGASSAMEQLLLELKRHYRQVAARVIGSVAVDEHHLTDAQLLAKARGFFGAA